MSGLDPASPSVFPSLTLGDRAVVTGRQWTCRILSTLDYHAVCAAIHLSNALRVHVAGTCSAIALNALADVRAARGTGGRLMGGKPADIACHAWSNVAHSRASLWLVPWQRVTLDDDGQARS